MPRYDFRCNTCEAVYEWVVSLAAVDEPTTCPAGHIGATRLLPVFATLRANPGDQAPMTSSSVSGGGCGGGCACSA